MLKKALVGFPTRPVLYLSIPVLIAGLVFHFYGTYQSCRSQADLRESFRAAIDAGADGTAAVQLSRISDFDWDRADILVNYKPDGATTDCPFDWDWSRELREKLIAADRLNVIVFLKDGKLVDYLEYPRDWAEFVDVENPYSRTSAIFRVERSPGRPYEHILSQAR